MKHSEQLLWAPSLKPKDFSHPILTCASMGYTAWIKTSNWAKSFYSATVKQMTEGLGHSDSPSQLSDLFLSEFACDFLSANSQHCKGIFIEYTGRKLSFYPQYALESLLSHLITHSCLYSSELFKIQTFVFLLKNIIIFLNSSVTAVSAFTSNNLFLLMCNFKMTSTMLLNYKHSLNRLFAAKELKFINPALVLRIQC